MARRIELWPLDRLVPYAKNARTHSPEQVAQDMLKGLEEETFVILPHPQVLGYMRKKTENYDRWISGMAKIQAKMREAYGK